ncbi:Hypothetical predicted protein [Xyrichtys novacula]|uniref:Uncharacterized protein n=1 Tax=Xyrichtys novacula TaxID=13765 RepID=A0AAV1GWA9_XYRNO|nr:Hypothetical predicted protein [Xyrichtys novacula]CAJ1077922.1 Hypothetical predicted protein [Xyrichtys novacula]
METTSQRFTRTSVLVRSFHWSCPRPILKRVTATPMSRSKPRCVRVEQYSLIQNQDKCTPWLLLRKVPPMDGPPHFSSPKLNQVSHSHSSSVSPSFSPSPPVSQRRKEKRKREKRKKK